MTLDVKFEEQDQTFSTNFGEVQTVGGGENGATFIPNVSQSGVISWTNDKGLENPTPVNIKGAKGDKGDRGEQGIQGIQGAKGTDGVNGKDGANGQDGFSPIVAVADIEGGHKVTITDKNGAKTFEVMDGKDGQGGSGGSAIIDVVELPTENIDEDSFYRLLTGELVFNRTVQSSYNCYCVDGLPQNGKPATNLDNTEGNVYYNIQDNEVYGYVDIALSTALSVPEGWYSASVLFSALNYEYSGVITNILDDPSDGKFRFLLQYYIYSYKNVWSGGRTIGWEGSYAGAEIFNTLSNIASGTCSHAEGYNTTANGTNSHTEGGFTEAGGDNSHAEGFESIANGSSSHAEGSLTKAIGEASHTEGYNTTARGVFSHAEGYDTVALRKAVHVQGRYNIGDYDGANLDFYGKYAHIVGNGVNDDNRSNAHTLDWNGLGWFAGGLKVGGTGQDDASAEEIPTKSQVQTMIDNAIANLPIYNGEVEEV